jgi:recombination associated protein RdgC
MLKNALIYRIEHWDRPALGEIDRRLSASRFVECAPTQAQSAGWVAPRGDRHGALVESVGGHLVLELRTESKAVPGSVVKAQLQAQLDAAEQQTGRRPKGRHAREIKDAVVHSLLPRAFAKRSDTRVWLDTASGIVWVGAGTAKRADAVLTRLVQDLGGGLKLGPLQTAQSPAMGMTQWLAEKEAPAGFSVDRECELKQPDSDKATVRYARHALHIDEVVAHLHQGKLPTQLAMTWAGRVSFVLTEALTLKKIVLLDVVLDGADVDAKQGGRDDGGFDADIAIGTGELRRLLPALIEALGGLHVPQAAAATLATAVPAAAPSDTVAA